MKTFFSFIQNLLGAFVFLFVIGSAIGSLYLFNLSYGDYNFCVNKKVLNNNYQNVDSYWRAIEILAFDALDSGDDPYSGNNLVDYESDIDVLNMTPHDAMELIKKSENINFFIVDDALQKIYLKIPISDDVESFDYSLSGYTLNWLSPSVNWLNFSESEESSIKYNEFNRVSMHLTVSNYDPSDQSVSMLEEYSCIKVDQYSYIRKLISMTIRLAFNDEASQNNLDPDSPKE